MFTKAELVQLCELLGLSDEELTLLLSTSSYIFEEGAYSTDSPMKMAAELMEAGVYHEQAKVYATVWREGAEDYIQQCKTNSVLAPQHLSAIDWQLTVKTAASGGTYSQRALALLQFRLASAGPTVGGGLPSASPPCPLQFLDRF